MSIENVSTDALIREMETLAVGIVDPVYQMALNEFIRRFKIAKAAIEQIEDPKPLTLEELRQMDGEPIYIHRVEDGDGWWAVIHGITALKLTTVYAGWFALEDLGKTWLAYRHKPKGE